MRQHSDLQVLARSLSNLFIVAVYYIVSAGLGADVIARSLGDLDGFVEHLDRPEIRGRLYAADVMDAGLVRDQPIFQQAYEMGRGV